MENKEFGARISRLIGKGNLTRRETREMFDELMTNSQPDLQQGAFLAALSAKGETSEEMAGAWEAIYEMDTVKASPVTPKPLLENSGTGMDTFKTFNVSTGAALVSAAAGNYMARHGARALSSRCGTIDLVEALGVDVECPALMVKTSVEQCGIGIFNGMSARIHPQALFRILSQIHFGSTLNISASLANPALPHYGARGVFAHGMVLPVAELMKVIGYTNALIFHGSNGKGLGLDEVSILGETIFAEIKDNRITTFTMTPSDFNIAEADDSELVPGDLETEAAMMVQLLAGKLGGAREDMVAVNAAPLLYLGGQTSTIVEGYKAAKEIIASGLALAKLRQWVSCQNQNPANGSATLNQIIERVEKALPVQ
ncbi:MAG: anthranilate phosphoribosyltransferase [Dehalogenimonas sp.]|jgi:anthranilate phosphoribosyltransferase|uniref:Anthranilate phosphoribosyltransferase n=2 Tax=Candidatus Dehalogenimonas loeffleri TaxID=3127115 RepID=A0ABZ2J743_9CHLR|nr:anthranilate phosphoribosyltransferase [Dehalogenimonas sp.]